MKFPSIRLCKNSVTGSIAAAIAICSIFPGLILPGHAGAQGRQVEELAQCRALSQLPDEIHNCLDNFLDALDVDVRALELQVIEQLGGQFSPLAMAFVDAQTAYKDYRASNCLWYQFSSPIGLAQQVAKACRIGMSRSRLEEINDLLQGNTAPSPDAVAAAETEDAGVVTVAGYYLYGVDRNSLQPCGTAARYWVEGDAEALAALQRAYAEQTTDNNPLLFVELSGTPDTQIDAKSYPGHEGVFRIAKMTQAQVSFDGDCARSTAAPLVAAVVTAPAPDVNVPDSNQQTSSVAAQAAGQEVPVKTHEVKARKKVLQQPRQPEPAVVNRPPQNAALNTPPLVAYFGDWKASCTYIGSSFGCRLTTLLNGNSAPEILKPVLSLVRRTNRRTIVDLAFPGQEIASISKISWTIDANELGVLSESRLRIGDTAVIQQLRKRPYIQRQLLPAMQAGYNLVVTVIDDTEGPIPYNGTLVGLTRALTFADRYAESGGKI